jgi:DNA-binding NarL/FixJ family response regulator
MAAPDLVRIVETAYHLEGEDRDWLTGVVQAAYPALDAGLGTGAYFFHVLPDNRVRCDKPVTMGARPVMARALIAGSNALPPEVVERTYLSPESLATTSQATGLGASFARYPLARMFAHPVGVHDVLAWKTMRPDRVGINVVAGLPAIASVGRRRERLWARVGAHLAAAWRLRHTLRALPVMDGAEAVFEADGRCAHAAGPALDKEARENLWQAALAQRWARGQLRHADPERAIDLWQGLIDGRWSLIEHFDRDGHRYLVCHRNDPQVPDPRALTERERQVLAFTAMGQSGKLIRYTLGLSAAAVSMHLTSGLAKLRLRTRAELAQVMGPKASPTPS